MSIPQVIPAVRKMEMVEGSFLLRPESRICCQGEGASEIGQLLADYLAPATGWQLAVAEGQGDGAGEIELFITGTPQPDGAGFLPEGYHIAVSPEQVRLEAESAAGLARAVQTLRQLFPTEIYADCKQDLEWRLPAVQIFDEPRFRWRGLHLDVCRHFFSVEDVCRFIELLAQHRYNICHLHLTEDQGWRLEIKKYPKLTEIGSVRPCTLIGSEGDRPRRYDDQPHGGFYSQDEMRRIVAFAARRHITLVPEIDMPGHMQAAIAAYPELGNENGTHGVRCHWGISDHILNVEESTVRFMQDVLDEVMEIFPGRFIHVGGDEAIKTEWNENRRPQERMAELGLKSADELQSWFIRRMDEHIHKAGRRMIGWDEILEGGLADHAAVMSWRGEEGGLDASGRGHDVVMAPHQWVYFDHYQAEPKEEEPLAIGGMSTLGHVYAYEPIPGGMTTEQKAHVLGSQGQLWTEYMPTFKQVEYMAYPRVCALSEVLWLDPAQKNYSDFLERLPNHRKRLQAQKVNAHPRP